MAEWMANVGGQEYGPFTWDQMLQMAAEGRITPELPVRKASDQQWSTAAAIPGLLAGTKLAAPKPAVKTQPAPAAGNSAVKVAKPLARPPVGKPVPPVVAAAKKISSGIPVGAPVRVVASPPPPPLAVPSPASFSLDLGTSSRDKARAAKSALEDQENMDAPKSSRALLVVSVLGAATLLVAVAVGLTIYFTMNRGGSDENIAATDPAVGGTSAEAEQGEANPRQTESAAGGPQAATARKGAKASNQAAQLAALQGIREWKNAATLLSIKIGNAKISFSRIWLSTAAGEKSTGGGEDPSQAGSPPENVSREPNAAAEPAGDPRKFVCVEVTVANTAGATLKYKGWNIAKSRVPFLADDQNRIFKLVPLNETPDIPRLTKTDVPGGGAISDILVFEAPTESFEKLRLVLPQNVFYDNTKNPYSGIEITPDVLQNEGGPPVVPSPLAGNAASEVSAPLASGQDPPAPAGTPENPAPAQASQPKSAVKKAEPSPQKPSLIDEINKSFVDQEKAKKMDEGKGKEPAKEPAKGTEPEKKQEPEKTTVPAKPTPAGSASEGVTPLSLAGASG
jgi:GYF domain 2